MRMTFTPDEVCRIVRAHLIKEYGLPDVSIENVEFFGGEKPRVTATVKTADRGGPYRSPPKITDTRHNR